MNLGGRGDTTHPVAVRYANLHWVTHRAQQMQTPSSNQACPSPEAHPPSGVATPAEAAPSRLLPTGRVGCSRTSKDEVGLSWRARASRALGPLSAPPPPSAGQQDLEAEPIHMPGRNALH